jgi:tRNA A-37 threonylcarbamoyl transferase component Bud32
VEHWTEFELLVNAESKSLHSTKMMECEDLQRQFERMQLPVILEEEHVTQATGQILQTASEYIGSRVNTGSASLKANGDITMMTESFAKTMLISVNEMHTPVKGQRAKLEREAHQDIRKSSLFTVETKPINKYKFLLQEGKSIPQLWEQAPIDQVQDKPLPSSWTTETKKVWHLVRQLFGQMVTDSFRYGVINLYEVWYFCQRTPDGTMLISSKYVRDDAQNPSVLQALRTLIAQENYELTEHKSVDNSPVKNTSVQSKQAKQAKDKNRINTGNMSASDGKTVRTGKGKSDAATYQGRTVMTNPDGSVLSLRDCNLVMSREFCKILITKDSSRFVKMVKHPRMVHHVKELRNEAAMYAYLKTTPCAAFIPSFHGLDESSGVPMMCTGAEDLDFEEIGQENLPLKLTRSALRAVTSLREQGVYHGDLALRNIVRSRQNPHRAKLIDFGRSSVTNDPMLLDEQIERARSILHLR